MTIPAICRISTDVFRVPLEIPVETSFGLMTDRPAVFVRLEDTEGVFGWGEIFANWPAAAAEHRANLLIRDFSPLVLGFRAAKPEDLWQFLTTRTQVRALQSGEWGPFRQVAAGLDTAMHDMNARRAGLPLAQVLNPVAARAVPVYASGIHVERSETAIMAARARGIRDFKVKVGFGHDRDLAAVTAVLSGLDPSESLMADANQAWTLSQALEFAAAPQARDLHWLEEPVRADCPAADWARLARVCPAPLAAGENIAGATEFEAVIASGSIGVLQPDVAKWGGVTGCLAVARKALAAGRSYCPHFLGGGIGLVASAHLLAAAGGPGILELDVNPNPLRDAFFPSGVTTGGRFELSSSPGLGISDLPGTISRYRTLSLEAAA